ncbi:MAG: tetratricopeptide repeat protein [Thermodesulfobacteriota bacterium]
MTLYCHQHPTRPAHWHCPKCDQKYCASCAVKREKSASHGGDVMHLCPKCMVATEWIAAVNLIEPFWKRLPKFFSYPFSLRPVSLILGLSVINLLFSGQGLINSVIRMIIWGLLLKYAYAVLKKTAQGNLIAPEIDTKTLSEDFTQVFKQLGLFFVLAFIFFMIVQKAGLLMGALYLVFAVLSIPAMIIILVTTDSLLNAINPLLFIPLALRIGWGYLLMYFFLILLASAPAVLAQYTFSFLPEALAFFILTLAENYYTIISYHLMGYVILQYHQEIGYKVHFEDFHFDQEESKKQQEVKKESQLLDQVNFLLKDGNHDEALSLMKQEKDRNGLDDPSLSEYYYKLLKMKKLNAELLAHAKDHLELLIRKNQREQACQVYAESLSMDAQFNPAASTLFKLGGWLNDGGKSREAIGIFNRLLKSYPDDPLIPKALFRAAQIYNDRLMNPEKAEKILQGLLKKYPDHDFAPQFEKYLKQMRPAASL